MLGLLLPGVQLGAGARSGGGGCLALIAACISRRYSSSMAWGSSLHMHDGYIKMPNMVCDCMRSGGHQWETFMASTVSKFKLPQRVYFRDALPKVGVGKILRRELRDEAVKRSETTI